MAKTLVCQFAHVGEHGSYRSGLGEPFHVRARGVSVGLVAVAELLGQVLSQIADAPGGVLRSGKHALGVELGPGPDHMPRFIIRADSVKGLVPGGQQLAGGGVG